MIQQITLHKFAHHKEATKQIQRYIYENNNICCVVISLGFSIYGVDQRDV